MRETGPSGVAAYLRRRVIEAGGYIRKVEFPSTKGAPDYLVCLPEGVPFWVETKSPTGRLRASQSREISALRGIGETVWVVSSKKEIDALVGLYRI